MAHTSHLSFVLVAIAITVSGCRIGAENDPGQKFLRPGLTDDDQQTNTGGSPAAGSGGTAGSGGRTAAPPADGGPEAGTSGGSSGASGAAGDTHDSDAEVDETGSDEDGGSGEGCSPTVEICNPVTNEGCPPAMQCAVDLLAATPTGYCTFSSPPMPGTCFNSGVTESCLPTETCFDFQCRKLCFCDDDCNAGECCRDSVGEAGFKVCGGC